MHVFVPLQQHAASQSAPSPRPTDASGVERAQSCNTFEHAPRTSEFTGDSQGELHGFRGGRDNVSGSGPASCGGCAGSRCGVKCGSGFGSGCGSSASNGSSLSGPPSPARRSKLSLTPVDDEFSSVPQDDVEELRMLDDSSAEPWLTCFLVVGFDVDKGQVVESCVPQFALTDSEKESVCFHAMPDSAASGSGREDSIFTFRIVRRSVLNNDLQHQQQHPSDRSDNIPRRSSASHRVLRSRPSTLTTNDQPSSISSRSLLLAHSLFRQSPDPNTPRGCLQKALVLVTSTPYLTVPHILLNALANHAVVFGKPALERAIADVSAWPDPRVQTDARALSMRFLNFELAISLPRSFLSSFAAPQAAVRVSPSVIVDAVGSISSRISLVEDSNPAQGQHFALSPVKKHHHGLAYRRMLFARGSHVDHLRNDDNGADVGSSLPDVEAMSIALASASAHTTSMPSPAIPIASAIALTDDIPEQDLNRVREGANCNLGGMHTTRSDDRLQQHQQQEMDRHAGASPASVTRCWPLCTPSPNPSAPPFHEVDLMRALLGVHDKVWALWEIVALGEPLVVIAPTPSQSSAAVLAIIGLIHPLPFVGDWRPYFCIQDPDFPRLAMSKSVQTTLPRGAVYGITSTHVLSAINFPHVLTILGADNESVNQVALKSGLKTPHRTHVHRSRQLSRAMQSSIAAQRKRDENATTAAAFDVRTCLLDRVTRPVLRAFDRYLVPTWGDDCRALMDEPYASDPFGRSLRLVDLDPDTFPTPEDLEAPGVLGLFKTGAVSRTRAKAFYQRFLCGPVFKAWWKATRRFAERECKLLHRNHMLEACVRRTGVIMTQLDASANDIDAERQDSIVELSLRIRMEITTASKSDEILRDRLSTLQHDLIHALPVALRQSVGGDAFVSNH
jgi:hypothetical protein